jgi:hypothetical protein
MKWFAIAFSIVAAAFLCGCNSAVPSSVDGLGMISVGMTMDEVVAELGEPSGFMSWEDVPLGAEPTGEETKQPVWTRPEYTLLAMFSEEGKLVHKQILSVTNP